MENEQQEIKDNFEKNLKAKDYLDGMDKAWNEEPNTFRFMLKFIYDVMSSGRFKGSKLLEIGSGATVHSIASASAFFSHITMSDYVQDNLDNLKKWIAGDSSLKQLLDIPAELEGFGNDMELGKKILESRIRSSIKRVTRCDMLSDNILCESTDDPWTSPPFDMIISCLTMEVVPKDFKGYCESLKNASKLLRSEGGLVMCGFLGGSNWAVGGKVFNHIQIKEDDLISALTEAGFGQFKLKTKVGSGLIRAGGDFTYEKIYCIAAEKL